MGTCKCGTIQTEQQGLAFHIRKKHEAFSTRRKIAECANVTARELLGGQLAVSESWSSPHVVTLGSDMTFQCGKSAQIADKE